MKNLTTAKQDLSVKTQNYPWVNSYPLPDLSLALVNGNYPPVSELTETYSWHEDSYTPPHLEPQHPKLIHEMKIPSGVRKFLVHHSDPLPKPSPFTNLTLQHHSPPTLEQDWMKEQGTFNPYEIILTSGLRMINAAVTHKLSRIFSTQLPLDAFDPESCIVITGASKGIGAELAKRIGGVSSGKIVLVARSQQALEQLAAEIKNYSQAEVITVPLDLGKQESAAELEKALRAKNLIPTTLILNAGYSSNKSILEAEEYEAIQEIMVNYLTPVAMIKRLGPMMETLNRKSKIIFTGSMACFTGFTGNSGYAGTRGAILNFLRSHRGEVSSDYPSLHLITFGQINTDASKDFQRWYLPIMTTETAVNEFMAVIRDQNAPFIITPGIDNKLVRMIDPIMPSLADAMTATVTGVRQRRMKKQPPKSTTQNPE